MKSYQRFAVSVSLLFGFMSTLNAQTWYDDALVRIEQHRKSDVTIKIVDWQGTPIANNPISLEMRRHAFRFGTAVPAGRINDPGANGVIFRQKLLENFNQVVFENDLKWPAWIGLWGNSFNWPNSQLAMDWCDANELPIRGHYLSWATWSGVDAWGDSDDTNTLQTRLFNHISQKAALVGDRVQEWDVINHPIGWTGTTYENFFGNHFYGDIVDHARSVVPAGVELWINEDNILAGGSLANPYETVIQNLIAQGSPPDGIGFQAHFVEEWNRIRSGEHVYDQLVRFGNHIPRLQVTEFDIDVGENDQWQADLMHDYLIAMFSHPSLEAITLWGFWENQHWRPNAALYRSDWSEKPALLEYRNLVYGDWWTDVEGNSDLNGEFTSRGFHGNYDVEAEFDGRVYATDFEIAPGTNTLEIVVGGTPFYAESLTLPGATSITNGNLDSLDSSDNDKLTLNTTSGREVSIEVKGTSPSPSPSELVLLMEGSTRSTIADVEQIIELYNFNSNEWEEVDRRAAKVLGSSLSDLVTEISITQNPSRFIETGTGCVQARFTFRRSGLTRRLTGYIDHVEWRVFD